MTVNFNETLLYSYSSYAIGPSEKWPVEKEYKYAKLPSSHLLLKSQEFRWKKCWNRAFFRSRNVSMTMMCSQRHKWLFPNAISHLHAACIFSMLLPLLQWCISCVNDCKCNLARCNGLIDYADSCVDNVCRGRFQPATTHDRSTCTHHLPNYT